jgi:hypothetical protein
MTEAMTQVRAPKRDRSRLVPDDVVSPNGLATHLGMTRQNVARLTAEAVLVQRSDASGRQIATLRAARRHRGHGRERHADNLIDQGIDLRLKAELAAFLHLLELRHFGLGCGEGGIGLRAR